MDMPGYLDYGKMGMMDPVAYGQAMDQVGLAQLFQQQKLAQEGNQTLAGQMANDQSAQMNPLLVQTQQLNNTGKDTSNQEAGLTLQRNQALQGANLDADQRAAALKMGDDKLKAAAQKIEEDYSSGDPVRIQRAQQGEQLLASVRAEQRKNAAAMALQQEQTRAHLGAAQIAATASTANVNANIAAGRWNRAQGKGAQDIQAAVQAGKMTPANAAVALQGAAMFEEDPEAKQKYLGMASQYEKLAMNLANARAGTSPDLGKLGVPVNQVQPAMGGQPALNSIPNAPPAALQYLQQHPEAADQFKAKYGYLP